MERIKELTSHEKAALGCAASLFDGWQETLIWSALEGIMGRVYVCADAGESLHAAACHTGDFLFFAGDALSTQAQVLLEAVADMWGERFAILVPQNEEWTAQIRRTFGERVRAGERYAIRKEGDVFDREHLQRLAVSAPSCVTIQPLQGDLYDKVMAEKWSRDFCSQFSSREAFQRDGLGFVALYGDELIGGASSYTRYSGGIEIQVETRENWRQVGVASACCARLILECMQRGLYPSWDAANRISVALARKLGYREAGPYTVLYLNENS